MRESFEIEPSVKELWPEGWYDLIHRESIYLGLQPGYKNAPPELKGVFVYETDQLDSHGYPLRYYDFFACGNVTSGTKLWKRLVSMIQWDGKTKVDLFSLAGRFYRAKFTIRPSKDDDEHLVNEIVTIVPGAKPVLSNNYRRPPKLEEMRRMGMAALEERKRLFPKVAAAPSLQELSPAPSAAAKQVIPLPHTDFSTLGDEPQSKAAEKPVPADGVDESDCPF